MEEIWRYEIWYGRDVVIESDHQPLEIILRKPLHEALRQLQRMMIELQRYDLTVKYLKVDQMYVADTLSRAFMPTAEADFDADERVCKFTTQRDLEDVCVQAAEIAISDERFRQIAEHTRKDPFMSELKTIIQQGWPAELRNAHDRKCMYTITLGTSWRSKMK